MDNTSLVGSQLGKYQIQAEIGRGGMGAVYKGYDPTLDRYVAIKVLAPHLMWQEGFVERFLREARSAARLQHPNIVTIYDVGQESGWYYYVMEYLDGQTLTEFIRRQGQLPIETVVSILNPLADALDYAHRNGLVHRDIKPANMIVRRGGRVSLTDFGIARAAQETRLTATGTTVGTPQYMSPEQIQGGEVDARSDQYSLAVVAYEMLSGRVPFQADSTLALMYKVVHDPPPPIRQVRPQLPVQVEEVLAKALAKQPGNRYPTVSAFVKALVGALVGQQVRAVARPGPAPREAAAAPVARQPRPPIPAERMAAPRAPAATVAAPKRTKSAAKGLVLGLAGVAALVAVVLVALLLFGGQGEQKPGTGTIVTQVAVSTPAPLATITPAIVVVTPPPGTETASVVEPTPADTSPPPTVPPVPATSTTALAVPPSKTPPPTANTEDTGAGSATGTADAQLTAAARTRADAAAKTATAEAISQRPPGLVVDFESPMTWHRGNEPYGELTRSGADGQVSAGAYSGKLRYDLPAVPANYVVLLPDRSIPIAGKPTGIEAWVYGDGSGHFLDAWIQDTAGEVRAYTLGKIEHQGWRQMIAWFDEQLGWPNGHIDGPDNGRLDYPVRFHAFVLDGVPDGRASSGTIYLDEVYATGGDIPSRPAETPIVSQPEAPTSQPASTPTSQPVAAVAGRIAFSAGGMLHIVNAATGQDAVAPIPGMRQPDLRADGQLVIANGEGSGRDSLWTVNARTGAFEHEQSPFTDDFHPFWSPDGSRFAYDSLHHGLGDYRMLYTQAMTTRKPQPEVTLGYNGEQIRGTSPVWMQNDWIAFTGCDYWPGGAGGSRCGIFRMPSWGGEPSLVQGGDLTQRATDEQGGQLLTMSQESGNWEVYLIPIKGGAARNLSQSPASNDGLGTWSPDGKLVAFASNRGGGWAVWAVRPDGTGLTKLFSLPAPPTGTWTEEHLSWGP